jgi:hypothetical protein
MHESYRRIYYYAVALVLIECSIVRPFPARETFVFKHIDTIV